MSSGTTYKHVGLDVSHNKVVVRMHVSDDLVSCMPKKIADCSVWRFKTGLDPHLIMSWDHWGYCPWRCGPALVNRLHLHDKVVSCAHRDSVVWSGWRWLRMLATCGFDPLPIMPRHHHVTSSHCWCCGRAPEGQDAVTTHTEYLCERRETRQFHS